MPSSAGKKIEFSEHFNCFPRTHIRLELILTATNRLGFIIASVLSFRGGGSFFQAKYELKIEIKSPQRLQLDRIPREENN